MMGLGFMGGGIIMFVVWIVLIGGGVWLVASLINNQQSGGSHSGHAASPSDILDSRYAQGELSREEYQAMKQDLKA
jgi:putative membrane protein